MSISILFYIITVLSSLGDLAVAMIVILTTYILLMIFFAFFEGDAYLKKALRSKNHNIILGYVLGISFIVNVFVPSKSDMYIMVGLYIGEKIIASDGGNEIINKSYDAIIVKLDDVIYDATTEKLKKELPKE